MAPCQDDNNNRSLDVFLTASHRYHSLPMCIQSRMWNLFFTDKKNRMKQNLAWWKKATCNAWLLSLSLSYSLFFIITIWCENFTYSILIVSLGVPYNKVGVFAAEKKVKLKLLMLIWNQLFGDNTFKTRNSFFIRANLYPLFKSRIDLVERVITWWLVFLSKSLYYTVFCHNHYFKN